MAKKYDYDLFVIGGGSGGIRAARWSAQLGAKVALCESDRLGGTCVIRGCIPKKFMVYGSEFSEHFKKAEAYGWQLKDEPQLNWSKFNKSRNNEIKRLEGIYSRLLKESQVDFISGEGSLKNAHTVQVKKKTYTARYILIAVGSEPRLLDIEGAKLSITSNEVFSLPKQPQSLLVIGSGYIGLEFASIFKNLGTDVQLMFRKNFILRGFDKDIRVALQEELSKRNIKMISGCFPEKMEKVEDQIHVTDNKGDIWKADMVLTAIGRQALTKSLNLEAAKVKTNPQGKIVVNKKLETSCNNIFAIGDCTNSPYELTPVATAEGMVLSEMLFSKDKEKKSLTYENIPSAVFTHPVVATVGLTEVEALDKGYDLEIYKSSFRPLKSTLTSEDEKTFMKLIVCKKTNKLLGCHMMGEHADEVIQGFAVAVKAKLTKKHLDQTIGIHPTSAEEFVTMRTPEKKSDLEDSPIDSNSEKSS